MAKLFATTIAGCMGMKTRMFLRHWREGFKNLWRNGWMTFASFSGVSVTLLVVGVFIVMAMNVQGISQQVQQQVVIDVTIKDSVTGSAIGNLQRQIEQTPGAKSVKYVSKAQGLENLKVKMKEYKDVFNGLNIDNPLPNEFIVQAVNNRKSVV